MTARIEASEVAAVFRQALCGAIIVKLIGQESWSDVCCGDVEFAFGTWRVTFFNDVMTLDYTDSVTAPDGRRNEYEDWFKSPQGMDPIDFLYIDELVALEALIEALKPEGR